MDRLSHARVILTGASGGLGSKIAQQLLQHQCKIGLVGRKQASLDKLAASLRQHHDHANIITIQADVSQSHDREKIIHAMQEAYQGIDILINNAAIMSFKAFQQESNENITNIFQTNVIAAMQLSRQVLPYLQDNQQAAIVNIGSTFGSIAFAYHTLYSASKFALRGFSESLRRELADTPIKVIYIAPRAIKTSLNSPEVFAMAKEINMAMDDPNNIAKKIVHTIRKGKKEAYYGFPESFFVRLNMLFPRLVDKALASQNKIMHKYSKT